MSIIVNLGKVSQRVLSWEEGVTEFNLSRTAMYGTQTTLSCGTTLTAEWAKESTYSLQTIALVSYLLTYKYDIKSWR